MAHTVKQMGRKSNCLLVKKLNVKTKRKETVRGLWFLWCEDLACDWLQHNKHSRHISGVHGNIISTVK